MKGSDPVLNDEPKIEDKWLIDPKLLYLGPKIAEGGHAKVYEGMYKASSVAVKILQSGSTAEEYARRREKFLREIMTLSRVQHENLIKFIGTCKDSNMVIVTELLMGGSLKKFLRALRPSCLDLEHAICFALDISRAMECLHANGIIHRDLKPDNLLLTGDQKKLKLADFGLAREETVTEMMTSETGTYRWMAPELYSTVTLRRGDKKHYNHKVDIYSFSIVLWELLTNRTPFEGMSNLQAAYAAAFKKVRPSVDNIPEDLVALLESCWDEDPNCRPEFQQITSILLSFLSSLTSVKTTPPPVIELGQTSYLQFDSPGTRHLMDRSREGDEMKPGNSSNGILGCFNECFS
ncbi:serine/threonine-protein kinase HT1-like protein [Cinnamomum micranthum f. kanehirae]|uniref:Serine/threonine-protein kinase HT1-like protein n=1 Tax=Cinnamomum micranthum f. kanehirae TaxID=337451 RepID=A0A3S3MT02_9MAGN|nr:serine/threonine-protein kinase HT1-like protein [Cinnamomum micranthum f. kanehirae]